MPLAQSDFDLWLSLSEAPGHSGLFFLGPADSRITFYSQQVRALRLVHALAERGRVAPNEPIAIIGAGAAGITAALAAALSGFDVTLYERAPEILPLQSGSPRLLHPHLYEWPFRGSLQEDAILPFLDWRGGSGGAVRDSLKANYEAAKTPDLRLAERLQWTLQKVERLDDEWVLTFKDGQGASHSKTYGTVIMAIGFGDERICGAAPRLDYWTHPGFGPGTIELATKDYFVSGYGDGGLTDALAVLVQGFEHVAFTSAFLDRVRKAELADAVALAEAGVPNLGGDLFTAYEAHVLPVLHQRDLIAHVAAQLRQDRRLVLNADPLLSKGRASRLNQVMVFALVHAAAGSPGTLRLSRGEVTDVSEAGAKFKVHGPLEAGVPVATDFDTVILRHGPHKAERFAAVGQPFDDYRTHHAALVAHAPELADPPRLAPETFDHFDKLFTDRRPDPGEKNARRAEAALRDSSLLLSWDPAFHSLAQQGHARLEDVAKTIETLAAPLTILLAASPARATDYVDILGRLAKASDGRLRLAGTGAHHAQWVALNPDFAGPPNARSPYPAEPLPEPDDLWVALEQSLMRLLERKLTQVVAVGTCDQLGPIHPTIAATLAPIWTQWRQQIDATPAIRRDFLRLLFEVEPAGLNVWDGDHACLPNLTSALVLMLATHAGEQLVPASCAPGNVRFGTNGVGLGSGCDAINGCPIEDFQDAQRWSVDALILSRARADMFQADELITDAGESTPLLTRARRIAPVVIPNTPTWRRRLGQDLHQWQAAVQAEFESWRRRQQEALEDA